MKHIALFILLLNQYLGHSQESTSLSKTNWTMYLADKHYFMKSDTMRLNLVKSQKEIKHGFTFLNDTTFKEVGGKICGTGRNNYTGLYSVNDTIIILDPTNGNKFRFKVNSKSIKLMELVLMK